MKIKRINAVFGLALVAGLILTGCSAGAPAAKDAPAKSDSKPAPTETTPPKSDDASTDGAVSGDLAAPGSKVKLGSWSSYEYQGSKGEKAVISARLVSIDSATQAQSDFLVSKVSQLKGYKISLIRVEQKKVSGDPIVFQSDYTSFYPASEDGKKVQAVTMIGWDDCKTNSFSKEFDTDGATLAQCYVGAEAAGGQSVVGALYAKFDGPYDYFKGKPILFAK